MQMYGFSLHPNIKLINSLHEGFYDFWNENFNMCGEFKFEKEKFLNEMNRIINLNRDSGNYKYIISEESISGDIYSGCGAKKNADRIFDLFGPIKIFVMIRNQQSYIVSAYSQYLSLGGAESFKAWMRRNRSFSIKLKYDQLISYYQKIFGYNNVLVLPFEMLGGDNGEKVMNLFFNFLGLESVCFSKFGSKLKEKPNTGFSIVGMKFSRIINGIRGGMTKNQRIFLEASDRFVLRHIPWQHHFITRNDLKIFKELFSESNKQTSNLIKINLKSYDYL